MSRFWEIAFTPLVKSIQDRMGSRKAYARGDASGQAPDPLSDDEGAFLAERDSFYMASVGEGGWPYIQHRGGAKGFVKVLDEHTLAFADYRGNRQYVSAGNVGHDDRVALIFVDYPNRARLKLLAHARLVTAADAPEVLATVAPEGTPVAERAFVLTVEGFDWNCPKHITPRFTQPQIQESVAPLLAKLDALEKENADLKAALGLTAKR